MKWRECRNRELWFTGPAEGGTYWMARKRGRTYRVTAEWSHPMRQGGDVVWWSSDGKGTNKCWRTREAAMTWCEHDARRAP